jgi:lysozyme
MTRLALLALLLLAVAGCGGGRESPRAPDGSAPSASAAVIAPRFGDADPHPWDGRAPQTYPVHGIDAARFQGEIDWPAARAAGVNFAFLKATEGGDRVDEKFADHWRGAGRAGVARGAYHFHYHCRPAAEQARWFIRNVPRVAGALPPVLDMEWTPFSPTCTIRPDGAVVRREAEVFLDLVEAHYGQRPLIYTSIDFWEDNQMWRIPRAEFWLRSVAAHPDRLYRHPWTFWQYSSTGLIAGVTGEVDLNVFAGSAQDWRNWLAARAR